MRISDWSSDVCSSDLKAALRSRQSSLSKRRRMMKTAIRSAIALAGALLVVSGVPIRAQSSVEDRSPDATRPSPSQDFYCGARKTGTGFYCDKQKPRPNPHAPPPQTTAANERLAAVDQGARDPKPAGKQHG